MPAQLRWMDHVRARCLQLLPGWRRPRFSQHKCYLIPTEVQTQGQTRLARMRALRVFWRLMLVLQVGLILTGGAVRLTKSGLGCPTWPECVPGSYKPRPNQVEGLHSWIEFGNRLLTFLLLINALILLGMAIYRKYLRTFAIVQIVGLLAQGVLGGITVLTHLNPAAVAGHYLLSSVLILLTIIPLGRLTPSIATVRPEIYWLVKVLFALTALVLIIGTVVTGSGPHAGDPKAPRYPFDALKVAWLHADLVIALTVATLMLIVMFKISKTAIPKSLWWFIGAILLQGVVGYVQVFNGLPEVLVAIHLLGSGLVWCAACYLNTGIKKG